MTDDWDRRSIMNILEDFYSPDVLVPEHSYSASGIYHQIQPTYDLNVSTAWVLGERRVAPALQQLLLIDYSIPHRQSWLPECTR